MSNFFERHHQLHRVQGVGAEISMNFAAGPWFSSTPAAPR
jgi:hypothetical protein